MIMIMIGTIQNQKHIKHFLSIYNKNAYVAVDQFRIVFVKEEEIYTTWRLDAESGR